LVATIAALYSKVFIYQNKKIENQLDIGHGTPILRLYESSMSE